MLAIISPAKTQDFDTPPQTESFTMPDFLGESTALIKELNTLNPDEIMSLMSVSEKIAMLNFERYKNWHTPFSLDNAKQALLAFKGDVYQGFTLESYTEDDFNFAQEHLRMLSGLYGLLRPLDLMQAYRLEMKIPLKNKKGKDLYEFWENKLAAGISKALAEQGDNILVNLASNEYYKALRAKDQPWDIVTPVFKEKKNGEYKMIAIFAKKARGMMSDYIIKNRIKDIEDLKKFDRDGYKFNKVLSTERELVFTRG